MTKLTLILLLTLTRLSCSKIEHMPEVKHLPGCEGVLEGAEPMDLAIEAQNLWVSFVGDLEFPPTTCNAVKDWVCRSEGVLLRLVPNYEAEGACAHIRSLPGTNQECVEMFSAVLDLASRSLMHEDYRKGVRKSPPQCTVLFGTILTGIASGKM